MSVAAVKWAIGQKVGDVTAKSVLFVLAWHHNAETGLCCPSIPTLQTECDIKSDNTVKSALKRLAALGLVTSERDFVNGAIKRTRYSLVGFNPSEIEGGSAVEGGSVIEGGSITEGGAGNAGGVPQDLPLPSLNPCPTVPQLLPPKENEREEEKEQVEDIRPKLADDVPPPSLDDYGIEDVPTDFNLSGEPAPVPTDLPETDKPIDRVPVKYFVDSYNEILGEVLGKVIKVTPQRRQLIGARYRDIWRDCECLNEDEARAKVRSFFSCISRSDFLMGRTNRQGAHASWKPTFDWLLQQRNYTKILEGAYRNGQR